MGIRGEIPEHISVLPRDPNFRRRIRKRPACNNGSPEKFVGKNLSDLPKKVRKGPISL
jgi:hypothetical protein